MSELGNPLAALPETTPHEAARDYGAALVRGGINLDAVNVALGQRGILPLQSNTAEYAAAVRDARLSDADTVRNILSGVDTKTLTELSLLELNARGGAKLTDTVIPTDTYVSGVQTGILSSGVPLDAPTAEAFVAEVSKAASDLQMEPSHVASLVENQLTALSEAAHMDTDTRSMWQQNNEAAFLNALGPDAEKQISDAQTHISKVRGKTVDLKGCAKAYGPFVALQLFQQAQVLSRKAR